MTRVPREKTPVAPGLLPVFFVVAIDLIGFGIVLPLLPFYGTKFNATPVTIGMLFGVYSLAQLIFSPIWGGVSDRIGRRPVMLVSTFGSSMAYLLFAYAGSIEMLFFSRILAGIMGGNIAAAQAYVADVTTSRDRARGMGMIGAAFGIGFAVGPIIASALIDQVRVGLFAASLSALSFFLVLFRLRETAHLSQERMGIFTRRFWSSLHERRASLFVMVLVLALGHSSLYGAFPLFSVNALHLTPRQVGILYGVMGAIAIVVQGGLIRVLTKKFPEERIFFAGTVLMSVGLFVIPLTSSFFGLMGALSMLAIGSALNGPTLTSMVSKTSTDYGATMGLSQGFSGLGRMIGPVWGGMLYSLGFSLPFVVTGLLIATLAVYFQKKTS